MRAALWWWGARAQLEPDSQPPPELDAVRGFDRLAALVRGVVCLVVWWSDHHPDSQRGPAVQVWARLVVWRGVLHWCAVVWSGIYNNVCALVRVSDHQGAECLRGAECLQVWARFALHRGRNQGEKWLKSGKN